MALPLVAVPIAMGAAGAAGALGQYGAARAQANAMMPDAYKRRLAELEAKERAGTFGLEEGTQAQMEAAGVAQRAGQMATSQARQMQQASAASGAALTGRDLFAQELGLQDQLGRQMDEEARRIAEADRQAAAEQRQQYMELAQRQSDAEAARKMANRQLIGDLVGLGLSTGASVYGASQFEKGAEQMLTAAAGSPAAQEAQMQMMRGQMAMGMAGAFGGGGQMRMPMPQPQAPQTPTTPPPSGGMSPAVNQMMTPMTTNPYGPRIVGYQQLPDGSTVPVYAQGGY